MSIKDSFGGNWDNFVVAYEPLWAIGTGKIASNDQTQEAHTFIRGWLKKHASAAVGENTRVMILRAVGLFLLFGLYTHSVYVNLL